MHKLKYTFKTDTLFKMLFVRNRDLLKQLVTALLGISVESIEQFSVVNEEISPENLGDKFCRLDINMVVNGQLVDLEIQVANEGDYPDRVMLYWAKSFAASLPAGESYAMLPRTIIISIIDFNLFACEEFHSFFQPLEVTRHTLLSDKMGFHFYELRKLPDEVSKADDLRLWLSLFRAETEEDLEKIQKLGVPMMDQAINAYYRITGSPEFREVERLREKARHDEAQALYHARNEGRQEGRIEGRQEEKVDIARNLLKMGMPFHQITQVTGLSQQDLKNLRGGI